MTNLAIIGISGSGKTVLSTVWAKRMSVRPDTEGNNDSCGYLEPKNWQTKEYVNDVFADLNQGQWVRSTEQGTKFDLDWILHLGKLEVSVKLIDSAGQDLKGLFLEDTYKQEIQDTHLVTLLKYIQSAGIIIFVMNLQHFRGESNGRVRWRNEAVYEEPIRMLINQDKWKKVGIVWTAWDLYKDDIENEYGNIEEYVHKELNALYNVVLDGRKKGVTIKLFTVAPVWDTETKREGDSAFRVPKANFTSYGLNDLSVWITEAAKEEQFRMYQWQAEQGNVNAYNNLGWCYCKGMGVNRDEQNGMECFLKAAQQGLTVAQRNLGYLYLNGLGTTKDIEEAKKWYRKAAEQGDKKSEQILKFLTETQTESNI
ncbi:MAG: sel1 repeat family protein [Planctomycetaceae bacterium]|jgi:hypothetical protein|nr:sel1 repeat family protein [Planctomycetaceae bacterium]